MENILDGLWIACEAQLQQFAMDLIVPHKWVRACDTDNQRLDVRLEPRSSSPVRLLERPLTTNQFSVPFENSLGLNQQNDFAQVFLEPPRLKTQTGVQGNKNQLFGT